MRRLHCLLAGLAARQDVVAGAALDAVVAGAAVDGVAVVARVELELGPQAGRETLQAAVEAHESRDVRGKSRSAWARADQSCEL